MQQSVDLSLVLPQTQSTSARVFPVEQSKLSSQKSSSASSTAADGTKFSSRPRRSGIEAASLAAVEAPRVAGELLQLALSLPALGLLRRGDGHPVLVMPGFLASDASTSLVRGYLNGLGYRALPWGLGRNLGGAEQQRRLQQRFLEIHEQFATPVSLVGQSLGGVFARTLARQHADKVRLVMTLGSPISMEADSSDFPVPCSAIYSRTDGVVPWQHSVVNNGQLAENIEVWGSHIGMAIQPAVWYAVADRLQYAKRSWRPFKQSAALSWAYPRAASAVPAARGRR